MSARSFSPLAVLLCLASIASAQTDSFPSQSLMRSFIAHVPSGTSAPPLVISMHGLGSNASQQQLYTGFDAVADREGFVVAYPNGLDNSWDITGNRDVIFISALIDTLAARHAVDLNRVYATGFSMGGYMSHRLGCALSNRIAAIAPVSGLNASSYSCSPVRGVSVLQIHGTADSVVLYSGVASTISGWVTRNACPATPVVTDPYPSSNPSSIVRRDWYGPGRDSCEVILLSVEGVGHVWPGARWGGETTDISSTEEIWAFFSRHWLPGATVGPRGVAPTHTTRRAQPSVHVRLSGARSSVAVEEPVSGLVVDPAGRTPRVR